VKGQRQRRVALTLAGVLLVGSAQAQASEGLPVKLRGKHPLIEDVAPLSLAALVDVMSTEWVLAKEGIKEGNPLAVGGTWGRVAIKTATSAGILLIVRRLHATGRHGAARWVKYGGVLVQLAVGYLNTKLGIEQERKLQARRAAK
jgi:hypothetical protein